MLRFHAHLFSWPAHRFDRGAGLEFVIGSGFFVICGPIEPAVIRIMPIFLAHRPRDFLHFTHLIHWVSLLPAE